MKKVAILVVAILAIMAAGGARAAQADEHEEGHPVMMGFDLHEQNGSGQSGSALITVEDGVLRVSVNISGGSSTPQPAHIHPGTCANLDPKPIYPLTGVVNGTSETILPASVTFEELINGEFALNVHKSAAEASVYVSCGDIPNVFATGSGETGSEHGGGTVGMPRTGNSDLTFAALLALLGAALTGLGLKLARATRK